MTTHDPASIFAQVETAIAARDTDRAFALLSPLSPQLTSDAELAATWLTLLRIAPARPTLQDEAQRIADRWPDDPELVIAACDALVRAAERRPQDEPQPEGGPADLAANIAERCLSRLPKSALEDPKVGGYLQMTRGNALRLARRFEEALDASHAAVAMAPDNGDWWFNLGLIDKTQLRWKDALKANEKARALVGDRKGVLWNLAIAATALGQGDKAVEAMRALGLPAERSPSGMPFVDGLPPVQVRVATMGSGHGQDAADVDRAVALELVWVSPLSPCHGVVQTATFRDASVDYGDLVLWDGTPVSFGELDGKPVPRFPLLTVLRKGDERIYRFVALEQQAGDVQRFGTQLPHDAELFLHHAKVEMICSRCASGDHMRKHEHLKPEAHRLVYGKLVAKGSVPLADLKAGLDAHLREHPSVQLVMPGLLEALGDTAAAGKAHQMWRGLERTAHKSSASKSGPKHDA